MDVFDGRGTSSPPRVTSIGRRTAFAPGGKVQGSVRQLHAVTVSSLLLPDEQVTHRRAGARIMVYALFVQRDVQRSKQGLPGV